MRVNFFHDMHLILTKLSVLLRYLKDVIVVVGRGVIRSVHDSDWQIWECISGETVVVLLLVLFDNFCLLGLKMLHILLLILLLIVAHWHLLSVGLSISFLVVQVDVMGKGALSEPAKVLDVFLVHRASICILISVSNKLARSAGISIIDLALMTVSIFW